MRAANGLRRVALTPRSSTASYPQMTDDLRDDVRTNLPVPVIELWNELEAFSDTVIQVAHYPPEYRTTKGGEPAAIMATHDGATIFLPTVEPLTAAAVFHELLHAQRLWVEGVPEIAITTDDENNWRLVGELEADLEHLVIIPRQIEAGFGEVERMQAGARRTWSEYPWPETDHPWRRRYTCLMHWLSQDLFEDDEITAMMRKAITEEGLFREAELFRTKAMSLLERKEDLIACAVRFLKIPPTEVDLRYVDVRGRVSHRKPIRLHR